MKCERCQGTGKIELGYHIFDEWGIYRIWPSEPCPDCNGNGQQHCCDGLQAQR